MVIQLKEINDSNNAVILTRRMVITMITSKVTILRRKGPGRILPPVATYVLRQTLPVWFLSV